VRQCEGALLAFQVGQYDSCYEMCMTMMKAKDASWLIFSRLLMCELPEVKPDLFAESGRWAIAESNRNMVRKCSQEEVYLAMCVLHGLLPHPVASYYIAICYWLGMGGAPKRVKESATFLTEATMDNPFAPAKFSLGCLHYLGDGVEKNVATAKRYLEQGAGLNHFKSLNALGNLYCNGEGVPKNHAEAARYYTPASDAGLASAQFSLAYLYQHGMGVARDTEQARKLFTEAAIQGHEEAKRVLRRLPPKK
jgi:TPR repeat protein